MLLEFAREQNLPKQKKPINCRIVLKAKLAPEQNLLQTIYGLGWPFSMKATLLGLARRANSALCHSGSIMAFFSEMAFAELCSQASGSKF